MFADRPLELGRHCGLQSGHISIGKLYAIGLQVGLVVKPNEMSDESKAAVGSLELTECNVVSLHSIGNRFEISNVSRLTKNGSIANHSEPTWIDRRQARDDEIGKAGHQTVVLLDPVSLSKIETATTWRLGLALLDWPSVQI